MLDKSLLSFSRLGAKEKVPYKTKKRRKNMGLNKKIEVRSNKIINNVKRRYSTVVRSTSGSEMDNGLSDSFDTSQNKNPEPIDVGGPFEPDFNDQSKLQMKEFITSELKKISSFEQVGNTSVDLKGKILLNDAEKILKTIKGSQPSFVAEKVKIDQGCVVIKNNYNLNYQNSSRNKTLNLGADKPLIVEETTKINLFIPLNIKNLPNRSFEVEEGVKTDSGINTNNDMPTDPLEQKYYKNGYTIKNSCRKQLGQGGINEIFKLLETLSRDNHDWLLYRLANIQLALLCKRNIEGTNIIGYRETIVTNYNVVQLPLDADSKSNYIRNIAKESNVAICIGPNAETQVKSLIFLNKQLPFIVENNGNYLANTHVGSNNVKFDFTIYTDNKVRIENLISKIMNDDDYFAEENNLIIVYNNLAKLFNKEVFEERVGKVTSNLILECSLVKNKEQSELVKLIECKIPLVFGVVECYNVDKIKPNSTNYSKGEIFIEHLLYALKITSLFTWLLIDTIESGIEDLAFVNNKYLRNTFINAKDVMSENILSSNWVGKLIISCDGGISLPYHRLYRDIFIQISNKILIPQVSSSDSYKIIMNLCVPVSMYILTNRGCPFLDISIANVLNGNELVGINKIDGSYKITSRKTRSFLQNICNTNNNNGLKKISIERWFLSFNIKKASSAIPAKIIQNNLQNSFYVQMVHSNLDYSRSDVDDDTFTNLNENANVTLSDPFGMVGGLEDHNSQTIKLQQPTNNGGGGDSGLRPPLPVNGPTGDGTGADNVPDESENGLQKNNYNQLLSEHLISWRNKKSNNIKWLDSNCNGIVCEYRPKPTQETMWEDSFRNVKNLGEEYKLNRGWRFEKGFLKGLSIEKDVYRMVGNFPIDWTADFSHEQLTRLIKAEEENPSTRALIVSEFVLILCSNRKVEFVPKSMDYYIVDTNVIYRKWLIEKDHRKLIYYKYMYYLWVLNRHELTLDEYLIRAYELDKFEGDREKEVFKTTWPLLVEYSTANMVELLKIVVGFEGCNGINEVIWVMATKFEYVGKLYVKTSKLLPGYANTESYNTTKVIINMFSELIS